MKKIGKLHINPEKRMKNEELLKLKGGDDMNCCLCKTSSGEPIMYMLGAKNAEECEELCDYTYGESTTYEWYC